MKDLEELERSLGYHFVDRRLLERALTHRSWGAMNNERLEFLGDSVLGCVIGQALFLRDKNIDEGSLTRVRSFLVREEGLDKVAAQIGVGAYLRLGEGEMKTGGAARPSIIADAMEALFGAVFTEAGFEKAREVILRLYEPLIEHASTAKDAKTSLQECLQARHVGLPQYTVVSVTGPAHCQQFECECAVPKLEVAARGVGSSRRAAEQAAAAAALAAIEAKHPARGGRHG